MPAPSSAPSAPRAVDHYENFPVASWLCPAELRPSVAALYWFARTADDIADEGDAPPAKRLADLHAFREDLRECARAGRSSARWPQVFEPLGDTIARQGLPTPLLHDLLSAFEQDVVRTRDGLGYADREELLDYCRRSANPVGRLMLHLYGVDSPEALRESDDICSALQLINFWQDLSVDIPRGRHYLPVADCIAMQLDPHRPSSWGTHPQAARLVATEVAWARELMNRGQPLVHRVPGRAGWELRAVVQGGLRITDRIEALGSDIFSRRPRLGTPDLPRILWRCLRMKQSHR